MEKVDLSKVTAENRPTLRTIGGTLGTKFFKAEARACILNFEERKLEVERNNNNELCLNRTPRRFLVKGHDIKGINMITDALGSPKVVLNMNTDEEVSIPMSMDGNAFKNVTEDALGKALRGDKNIIFSDALKLAEQVNLLNYDEKERLVKHAEEIRKSIQQLDSAIAENNKKVDTYLKELMKNSEDAEKPAQVIIDVKGPSMAASQEIIVAQ